MSQEQDEKCKERMMSNTEKYLQAERSRPTTLLTEEEFLAHRERIQKFIEESGCTMVVLCEFPDGGVVQFNNKGLTTSRGIGLLQFALMDNQSGMTSQRTFRAIQIDREYGKVPIEERNELPPPQEGEKVH